MRNKPLDVSGKVSTYPALRIQSLNLVVNEWWLMVISHFLIQIYTKKHQKTIV